jgi:hypothetical protein
VLENAEENADEHLTPFDPRGILIKSVSVSELNFLFCFVLGWSCFWVCFVSALASLALFVIPQANAMRDLHHQESTLRAKKADPVSRVSRAT